MSVKMLCAACAKLAAALVCLAAIASSLLALSSQQAGATISGPLNRLSRADLLRLDHEVSQFYMDSYAQLDRQNTTFEQQLYKAIRAVRHTSIQNHFDFRYTSNATKWRAMGARVNRALCQFQLAALVAIVNETTSGRRSLDQLPLSVFDFLDASGQTGSGILNGNFAWLGSSTSCERARIPADIVAQFAPDDDFEAGLSSSGNRTTLEGADIVGRYCVAHMRAKSWPKADLYFRDRITVRRGLCLPQACHSALYDGDEAPEGATIRRLVDILARAHLLQPFSEAAKFETSHLYCLPDEDSPHRQLDLGSKLFLAFAAAWLLLTIWVNIKYAQRRQALRQLRDTIDIRMIIDHHQDHDQPISCASSAREPQHGAAPAPQFLGAGAASRSACSSGAATLLPSDFEADDSDVGLIEPFKAEGARRRRRKREESARARAQREKREQFESQARVAVEPGGGGGEKMDFFRALSLEANLNFLFYQSRPIVVRSRGGAPSESGGGGGVKAANVSSPIGRRSSSSNEALVKDLQSADSNVAIISKARGVEGTKHSEGEGKRDEDEDDAGDAADDDLIDAQGRSLSGRRLADGTRERRVNTEVLDGLKVLATCYIVYGHTMMFFFGCIVDLRFGVERMFDFTMIATLNTLQIVGLFYVITGCLLTYFSFSKAKPKQLLSPIFWLLVLVGRYLRLIPAYALVFWFARHLAPYTGNGRDWYDYRTDGEHARGFCGHESWWVMWTMSAADVKIPNDCLPQAWYLSDDFRTLMVLPVYVYLLARNARLGYAAIFATFGASIWKMGAILKAANIDYKILLHWHPHVYALMTDRLHDVYTDFLVRMSTYLLGVIVGHLLYLYEIRYIRRWPRWFARYGMKAALLVAACFYFGAPIIASPLINQFLPGRDHVDSDTVVWLIPLFKSSMELAISVILLLLVTGGGHALIRRLLASQTMKILSNISYAVFLTHIELMYKLPATQYESNYYYLFIYAAFCIAVSHLIAFALYLLWEMPINNLTRNLFKRAFRAIG